MIATLQEQSCYEIAVSRFANAVIMDGLEQDTLMIQALCAWTGMTPTAVAKAIGSPASTITKPHNRKATSRLSQPTIDRLRERFPDFPEWPPLKAAGADTPPPALDTQALAKTLEVVQPFLSAAPGREDVRLEAADAIATLLDEIDSDPTILDDPERWAPVARVAAGHLRKLLGDSAVSDKRTQRHKSDNS